MKKIVALFAALMLMLLATTAMAATYQPGDTVEVPIYMNTSDAAYVKVRVSGSWCTITGVSSEHGQASGKNINGAGDPVVPSGQFGTATVKINDGVASGTYTLTVTVSEAYDINENDATASAYSGSVTIEAPACEHSWNAGVVTTEATCEADGVKTYTCGSCGETKTEAVAAIGHAYDDGVETKAATCKEEGVKTYTCGNCGDTYTEAIAKSDKHTWDNGVVTKEMTCLVDGEKTFTCTVCGTTDVTVIEAPGKHTYDETKADVETAPTCETAGKGSFTCTVCGTKIDGGEIPALGHDKTETVTKEATCGAAGEKTITCSRCDYKETVVIPATGNHTYETKVTTEATCGKAGVETTTCTVCGDTSTKEIPATGKHTYEVKVTKEATCTDKGEKTFTCSVCNDSYTEEIAAKGHTPGADLNEKAPTCTKSGYKYYTCSVCGTEVKESDIPATGEHIYEVTEEVPATCEKDGKRVSKCTYEGCDKTKTEKLKKLGHKMGDWYVAKAATCTENGKEQRDCLNGCGKSETRVIKASHTWGEWVVNEEENNKTHVCSVCGVSETKSLSTHYTMTVCSYGIRFRDLDKSITNKWYMFTPIDLSVEGEQTVDLIAGNMHQIGTATILVKDGKVTVTTKVNNARDIAYSEDFLTFVPALADLTELDFDTMTNYAFGEEISIEEALGGDTKVLLLIRNNAWYEDSAYGVNSFKGKGKDYNAYVESLKELMD